MATALSFARPATPDALKQLDDAAMKTLHFPQSLSRDALFQWLLELQLVLNDVVVFAVANAVFLLRRADHRWMDGLLRAIQGARSAGGALSAMLKYASPSTLSAGPQVATAVQSALVNAWSEPYQDPHKVLDCVAETIDNFLQQWKSDKEQVAAWTMVLQSSGWGKSRTIQELTTRGFFVVYVSFMKAEKTGVPPRSPVANLLREVDDPRLMAAWLVSIISEISGKSPEEWRQAQSTARFSKSVEEKYKTFSDEVVKSVASSTPVSMGQPWDGSGLTEWIAGKLVPMIGPEMKIIICLDEAASWFGEVPGSFLACRRLFSCVPRDVKMLGLVADTAGKLGLIFPERMSDPSARATAPATKVFEPIWVVGSLWLDIETAQVYMSMQLSGQDPCWPSPDLSKELYRWGRPLWRATLDNGATLQGTVSFAIQKLLGGLTLHGLIPMGGKQPVTDAMGIAILGVAVGLEVAAWSELAKDMVASHMRTVSHVSGDRERVFTADALEPVLGEAGAEILSNDAMLCSVLQVAERVFKQAYVVEGPREEIVGRLVLILAMHACCESKASYNRYTHPVFLQDFVSKLCGRRLGATGLLCFNRFIFINRRKITRKHLLVCFLSAVAIIPQRNQEAFDVLLPVLMPSEDGNYKCLEDRMTAVAVQIQNRDTFAVQPEKVAESLFEWMLPQEELAGSPVSEREPLVSSQLEAPEREHHPRDAKEKGRKAIRRLWVQSGLGNNYDGDDDENGEPDQKEPNKKKRRVVEDGDTLIAPFAIYMHLRGRNQKKLVEITEDGQVLVLRRMTYQFLKENVRELLERLCSAYFNLTEALEGKSSDILQYNLSNYLKVQKDGVDAFLEST